jgi:predicted acetyltransferase
MKEYYMDILIVPVSKDEKEILRNLIEKYDYEFSQYHKRDVNDLGLYDNDYIINSLTENNSFAYFIKVDNKLAGFVMVNDCPIINLETNYTMADFFVLYKYRKTGVGTFVVKSIFEKYKGKWGIMYHPKNIPSKKFWNKVVHECTNGKYETIKDNKEANYEDGTISEILVFET